MCRPRPQDLSRVAGRSAICSATRATGLPEMSEIPPTYGHGASAPAEPARTPRLSDEAESILQRRGPVPGRNVALTINRLNLQGEQDDIRRGNEVIVDSYRKTVSERYGPSIADRTGSGLAFSTGPTTHPHRPQGGRYGIPAGAPDPCGSPCPVRSPGLSAGRRSVQCTVPRFRDDRRRSHGQLRARAH